jgi:DNA-binding Lrp family transcriptional regulator
MEKTHMLISCEIGDEQFLHSKLKEIPEIKNCLITYGSYDIVVEFITDTFAQMNEIISSKIKKICSTLTLRAMN